MKVLVTGASGFLGRHLVRRLLLEPAITQVLGVMRHCKYDIYGIDREAFYAEAYCDLTIEDHVVRVMRLYKPDIVFHMAANALIKENEANPVGISKTNIMATHNLLAYAKPSSRFIFASSAAVYGDGASLCATEETPCGPNSVYGATKIAGEALVEAYHRLGKVSGLSLRLVANVGPDATHGVVKDIIAKLRCWRSLYLELLGDAPGSTKPYVHVSDTIEAAIRFGLDPQLTGVVNIASDDELNVEELAEVVMNTLGIRKPIRWLGESANWKGDNRIVRVDNSVAKSMGWKPNSPRAANAVAAAVKEIMEK